MLSLQIPIAARQRRRRVFSGNDDYDSCHSSEGQVPLIDISGTSYEAGLMLGFAWKEALQQVAVTRPCGKTPWWMDRQHARLVERYVPHIPDIYRGMAKGAGIPENSCADPVPGGPETRAMPDGCTSFAIAPAATLDGIPISGQTKDTGLQQQFRYQVLRLCLTDAPSALTLTYPGLLFGHGFVAGGCSVFRNSLYAGEARGKLAYEVWGLLALHCRSVDEVADLTRRYGVHTAGHCTVSDEHGGIIGVEFTRDGAAFLKPRRSIYVHANAVAGGRRKVRAETSDNVFLANSGPRVERLRARLEADRGRLTPQLAFAALCDHANYPVSICRHAPRGVMIDPTVTTAAVVVEPTRRRLTCTRGAPCMNWPRTLQL